MRKADKEMHRKGYLVLPPRFRSMEKLTLRAEKIVLQLGRKDIQKTLSRIGLEGDLEKRSLTAT